MFSKNAINSVSSRDGRVQICNFGYQILQSVYKKFVSTGQWNTCYGLLCNLSGPHPASSQSLAVTISVWSTFFLYFLPFSIILLHVPCLTEVARNPWLRMRNMDNFPILLFLYFTSRTFITTRIAPAFQEVLHDDDRSDFGKIRIIKHRVAILHIRITFFIIQICHLV